MPRRPIDHEIAGQARRQHGLVTREQLLALGLSADQISYRLRSGRLNPSLPGVYRHPGSGRSYHQDLLAGVLAAGVGAVASHRAACVLWSIDAPGVYGVSDDPPVEVSVPTRRCPKPRGVILHRSLDLVPEQVTKVAGIAVTNPLRLLVDLGAVVPGFLVERALEQLLERRLVTVAGVELVWRELARRGRRGAGVLREVLENRGLGDQQPEARSEAVFANVCRDYGLPVPDYQHRIVLEGRRRRIDFAYPALRIAIEIDGFEYHGSKEAFQDDRAKSNALMASGWVVLRFTWNDLVYRPWWVARIVDDTVATRSTAHDRSLNG